MSSLALLVPGSRLRMRALQFRLRKEWDFQDREALVSWDQSCLQDLQWWSEEHNLTPGVPLKTPLPDFLLYSDASDQGWGASLGNRHVSGLWSELEKVLSISMRELLAIHLSLKEFLPLISNKRVGVFCDNTTAIAYLKKEGGTKSESLNSLTQVFLRDAEANNILLIPQFVAGSMNVIADSLSRSNQVLGAEWTLCQTIVQDLIKKWPANVDLFATSLNFRLPIYFSPVKDPMSAGTDAMLHSWDNLQASAFPPFGMVHKVINKLRESTNAEMTLVAPFWPQKSWFSDLLSCW